MRRREERKLQGEFAAEKGGLKFQGERT